MIVEQKAQKPPYHSPAEDAQLGKLLPHNAHHREENRHRNGDAGGQAVQPVGDVHRVHRTHDDKGRQDHVHHPVQHHIGVEKRDVQVGAQMSLIAQQAQKGHRRRQLQKEFLNGRKPGIVVVLHLLIVVNVADDAEHQGKQIHIDVGEIPLRHAPPAQCHHRDADADDEHKPAHGRRALLGHVPGGADLLDALSRLQLHQLRDQQLSGQSRNGKADNTG